MPLLSFPAGTFPAGGFCNLSPTQLAPLQMYPPYIFMGFPLHPQLLQSPYSVPPVAGADPTATHPTANPAKRKSTQPTRAPADEKLRRSSTSLHSAAAGHLAYLPLQVTSTPAHDRKQLTSSGGRGFADSRQGVAEFDQDGALDLTKK